ncbi:MAG: tetratricopeptide repeat protein [Gemmatimonadetes bacterium]|nr:tetratricopeptide repeat protein [Gemmatimonadota bacterium]
MAYQSEVEKLTAQWNVKPEQYFAPLADAYRKAGDVDMALEVVRAGLTKRPTYLSAHIVLGRCFLDQKNDVEAAMVFNKVLELDAENIIALRVLGEISERQGDLAGAYKWVKRLLEVDPMNDDAQDALKRLEPAAAPLPVPAAVVVEPPAEKPAAEPAALSGFEPTSFAEPEVFQLGPSEPAMPDLSAMSAVSDLAPSPVEGLEPLMLEPEAEAPMVLMVGGGDTGLELDQEMNLTASPSSEFETAQDAMAVPEPDLIPLEDLAPEPEPASQALAFMNFTEPTPPAEPPPPVVARPSQALRAPSGVPLIMPDEEPAPEPVAALEAPAPPRIAAPRPSPIAVPESQADTVEIEPVITETMAEVYLKQGLVHEAREVYRKLVEMRPADAALRSRLAALEQRATGTQAAPTQRPKFAVADMGGQPARSMLAQMLSSRPAPGAPESGSTGATLDAAFAEEPAAGAPTSPASDELSLASVFGEEATPPAAARPAATPAPGTPGFSFDEFFGGKKPDAKVAPAPAPAAEPEATPGDFLTWLKGLKS